MKKVIGKYKIETPKTIWIDEFVCLRGKMFSFEGGNDSKNKLKGVSKSQSKQNMFEEYKKCLDGEKCQKECNNYILRSINHEMHLQEITKSTLSIFDDKRCYVNECKSTPWSYSYLLSCKWL